MRMMNLKFFTVAIALVAFTLAGTSCGDSGNNKKTDDQEQNESDHQHNGESAKHSHTEGEGDHQMDNGDQSGQSKHVHEGDHDMNWTVSTEDGKTIATGYLGIKDALVNTNKKEAAGAAKSLLDGTDVMEGDEALDNFRAHVQEVANAKDVETQRQAFEHLSEHVYLLAKNNDLGVTVYKQYCPMAFDNKGAYWLSSKEEIMNPYFGDKMLNCGKTQETLAAK